MNLEYKVLWFEDNKEWYEATIPVIEDFLKENGFILESTRKEGKNDSNEAVKNSDDYDLILMDYTLDEIKGDILIEQIREHEIYTDVIFYSQDGEKAVRTAMKEKGLDGVFCADRKRSEFLDKVYKVIKTTIKKVEDLNNIRGLVMAATSELDKNMYDAILKILKNLNDDNSKEHKNIVKKRYLESLNDRIKKINNRNEIEHFEEILKEIDSSHKIRAIRRLEPFNEILKKYNSELTNYDERILKKRNKLAHVKESRDKDGKKILISDIPNNTPWEFNENEAIQVRKDLQLYSNILKEIIDNI